MKSFFLKWLTDNRNVLIRPRSLVFATSGGHSAGERPSEDENVRPMKKYKSVIVLRESSISPRHTVDNTTTNNNNSRAQQQQQRIYRTSKPVLTASSVSPSKVRERIRQMNTSRNLERGSRSLPRKATRRMTASEDFVDDYDYEDEQHFELAEPLSWSDSDWVEKLRIKKTIYFCDFPKQWMWLATFLDEKNELCLKKEILESVQ